MRIIWDEPKRLANVLKHGFDFADLDQAYFDNSVVRPARPPRWFAFGRFDEKIIAVVFSPLGREAVAIVSMRPANAGERSEYDQAKGI